MRLSFSLCVSLQGRTMQKYTRITGIARTPRNRIPIKKLIIISPYVIEAPGNMHSSFLKTQREMPPISEITANPIAFTNKHSNGMRTQVQAEQNGLVDIYPSAHPRTAFWKPQTTLNQIQQSSREKMQRTLRIQRVTPHPLK